ncbi:hypothetical protein KC19_7G021100 [Ceratodon purpureus]|uniref:Uncharacterized protein n=1 Tax=Ceratodon purpureus TaxID=3225 RepID=A0A8T0H549_CERPU|nr:hypothetical protein KC19_7G019900 [Ceratodon purpureus]KAG0565887.1 hypothetical protein KC19_7G021100 [Ceratodon purpureus]
MREPYDDESADGLTSDEELHWRVLRFAGESRLRRKGLEPTADSSQLCGYDYGGGLFYINSCSSFSVYSFVSLANSSDGHLLAKRDSLYLSEFSTESLGIAW